MEQAMAPSMEARLSGAERGQRKVLQMDRGSGFALVSVLARRWSG